ncbi:MAG: hypothetical protein WCD47_11880 [Candidatus Sulfotelmatobacter sp.]
MRIASCFPDVVPSKVEKCRPLIKVKPGTSYQIKIAAKDFADWTSPAITLEPGQFKIVTGVQLRVATERTTVDVHYDPVQVATEQFKAEEKQRVFGIIPNFYVSYESALQSSG